MIDVVSTIIALICFILAVSLFMLLRSISQMDSQILEYTAGKIPLRASYYTPWILAIFSKDFTIVHNYSNPRLYLKTDQLVIKVLFENSIYKKDIKEIKIYTSEKSIFRKQIQIVTKKGPVYTCYIKRDEINYKQVMAKFREYEYDFIEV